MCLLEPAPAPAPGAELDGSFVQTWMGEGSEEGVAAAAARRRLLDSAANFGEAVLPGAYPPPAPTGPTVSFTAILGGMTVASFTLAQQTKYTNLVKAQATSQIPVGAGAGAATTVKILSFAKVPTGLLVRTQVVLPRGQNGPAQRLVVFLNVRPGIDAPWLDAVWKGSSVSNAVRWAHPASTPPGRPALPCPPPALVPEWPACGRRALALALAALPTSPGPCPHTPATAALCPARQPTATSAPSTPTLALGAIMATSSTTRAPARSGRAPTAPSAQSATRPPASARPA